MPCPPGWSDKTQIEFRKPERGFQHCHFSIIFGIYQFNIYFHQFVFCVHSDHLGSRYELSAFGTLQSSVSRQEEVQGHESVHSKFCNSRVFSEGLLPSGFNYWQRSQILCKMYLALFVEILVFLTFLPGLFVAGPRGEEEFKKCQSLELRVAV